MLRTLRLLVCSTLLVAQSVPPVGEIQLAMKRLAPMVGVWTGEGWISRGPGEPKRFKGQEAVEAKLDGQLLLIEGRHLDEQGTRAVHHAFAVVSYDPAQAIYHFRSHLADGQAGDYRGEWKDGAFIWSIELPKAGRIRYTIRIDGDLWMEVGEMERGGIWSKFFEMKMHRS